MNGTRLLRHLNLFQPGAGVRVRTPATQQPREHHGLPPRGPAPVSLKVWAPSSTSAQRDDQKARTVDGRHRRAASSADASSRSSGRPGCGKSLLAQRLAVNHCDDGRLVVWTRAGDYEAGRFGELVARPMSRCSKEPWRALVGAAKEFGVAITVVLDGLNECPIRRTRRVARGTEGVRAPIPGGRTDHEHHSRWPARETRR